MTSGTVIFHISFAYNVKFQCIGNKNDNDDSDHQIHFNIIALILHTITWNRTVWRTQKSMLYTLLILHSIHTINEFYFFFTTEFNHFSMEFIGTR